MKKFVTLMLLATLCCASAFAARGVIAEDSAANYTANTFVSGANLGTGFKAWEFWNAAPTLADSTAGVCGNINSENGVSFRFARDGDDAHYGYCNGYRGFDALNTGDVLTFKFTCAYCAGNRGLDLFANGGHDDSDKIANVINLSGDNEYSVNGNVIASNWAPHAVSEVTVTQLADGIQIAIKRTSTESDVDDLEYTTTVETSAKLTGIGLYAGGWDWNNGADVENYAFYVNDLKIEGDLPEGGNLTLQENDGKTLIITPDATTFSYTVSVPEAPETDLTVNVNVSGTLDTSADATVTISAGQTSATFDVEATVAGNGNSATVTVSATDYASASAQILGPSYRWSMQVTHAGTKTNDWDLEVGDTVQFWINNDSDDTAAANAYITASTTDADILSCSALADWNPAGEGGNYTSGLLTAAEPDSETSVTFQIKFGDVVMDEYGFHVYAAPAPIVLDGPSSLIVGESATVTVTANDLDGATLRFKASDDFTAVTVAEAEDGLYPEDTPWTGTFTVTGEAVGTSTITVYDEDNEDTVFATLEITVSELVPTLSLSPSEGYSWAVTSPDTTVSFTVTCDPAPATALTLAVSAETPDWAEAFDFELPAAGSVVIAAGETSTTFDVPLKTTALDNALEITVSDALDSGYQSSTYGVKGPFKEGSYRWSMQVTHNGGLTEDWGLNPGDTVQFWINNDSTDFQDCNAYITAGVTTAGLTCSALDPWGDAGEGGTYTSGLLTAVDAGEHAYVPFQIKYGDAVIFEYGFNVYGTAGGGGVAQPVKLDNTSITVAGSSVGFTLTGDSIATGDTADVYVTGDLVSGEWTKVEGAATVTDGQVTITGISIGEGPLFIRLGND